MRRGNQTFSAQYSLVSCWLPRAGLANNTDANCGLAAGGAKWTYAYTSKNDIDLATDPTGNKTDYVYDDNGNLIEVQRKDSGDAIKLRTCFSVPTSGQDKGLVTERIESTTLTDCTGNKAKFEYDAYGNVTAVVDPRFSGQPTPPKTTMTYDLGGRRLTVTNELSHTTTFTYDNQNNVLTARDHLNHVTTYTYDAKGNLRTVTDANAKLTTYTLRAVGTVALLHSLKQAQNSECSVRDRLISAGASVLGFMLDAGPVLGEVPEAMLFNLSNTMLNCADRNVSPSSQDSGGRSDKE